jgi:hypothetical protein
MLDLANDIRSLRRLQAAQARFRLPVDFDDALVLFAGHPLEARHDPSPEREDR